jgi:hypothetical protein
MNNTDHPADDQEQFSAIPTDYRALLATTRPLIVTEHALPAWRGGEICRSGFGILPEPEDWRRELALRRGEILGSDEWGLGIPKEEELAKTRENAAAEPITGLDRRDSKVGIRICLGMS